MTRYATAHRVSVSGDTCPAASSDCVYCRNTAAQPTSKLLFLLTHALTHTHTFGQVDGGGWASWKAGIMCLTGSLSDLSVPAEKQPGGRQLLTKMTNVHWAFPIPLLSVRTNASYCACVCVCVKWLSATEASNKWHRSGPIYFLCFTVKNGRLDT